MVRSGPYPLFFSCLVSLSLLFLFVVRGWAGPCLAVLQCRALEVDGDLAGPEDEADVGVTQRLPLLDDVVPPLEVHRRQARAKGLSERGQHSDQPASGAVALKSIASMEREGPTQST